MFEKMLDHPNIKVMTNTDYREVAGLIPFREMIYTGPIDEFFEYRYGKLPYRSLQFSIETHDRAGSSPARSSTTPTSTRTRGCTEFKYLTGQEHPRPAWSTSTPAPRATRTTRCRGREQRAVPQVQGARGRDAGVHFAGPARDLSLLQHGSGGRPGLTLYAKLSGVHRSAHQTSEERAHGRDAVPTTTRPASSVA
jgi:UDP-galactopyranose mutase